MGCSPSTDSKNNAICIRPVSEELKTNYLTPPHILKKPTRQLSSANARKHREERDQSTNSSAIRYSSPPIAINDFWGTMPLSFLIDRLYLFHEEIDKQNGSYSEVIDFIRLALNDLANNFEHSSYKVLKKNNAKFRQFIGKYTQGIFVVKCFGYREKDDCFELDKNITEVNVKYKIKELEHAVSKIELKTGKIININKAGK
ncbi:hypothetical protein SteCoe_18735 [Stentor coeruleus]|uniref:PUB domain-containing protein n=1 Tax=Stentor coeruleus TaxID=5963 RepID=A0A1R2BVX9_9CILI|nr:hypothetical protein SteCoe_18735 [Stentor coeruleus]